MMCLQIAENVPDAVPSSVTTIMTGQKTVTNVLHAAKPAKTSTPGKTIARNAQNAVKSAAICIT
jgi:hypothetical protein